MYIIINKILTILVGLFSFLYGFSVIYRICKKENTLTRGLCTAICGSTKRD